MKIQNIIRYHLTLNAYYRKDRREISPWGPRKSETLAHDYYQCKLIQSLWNRVWRFPQKVKIELLCDLLPSPLCISTEEILKAFTSVSYAHHIVFTIAKLWKNTKHLSMGYEHRKCYTSTFLLQYTSAWTKESVIFAPIFASNDICTNVHEPAGH